MFQRIGNHLVFEPPLGETTRSAKRTVSY